MSSAYKNRKSLFKIGEIENKKNINFFNRDALEFKIQKIICLIMFNPFGCKTVLKFIQNNFNFLNNSKSYLQYANDICVNEISDFGDIYN